MLVHVLMYIPCIHVLSCHPAICSLLSTARRMYATSNVFVTATLEQATTVQTLFLIDESVIYVVKLLGQNLV